MRQTGRNPRRLGTNASAGTVADINRVDRLRRRAVARWRVATGLPWCPICDDDLVTETGAGTWEPCPTHKPMTANEAADILVREWTELTVPIPLASRRRRY